MSDWTPDEEANRDARDSDTPYDDPGQWEYCGEHEIYFPADEVCPDCETANDPPYSELCPHDFGQFCPDCDGEESEPPWDLDDVVGLGEQPYPEDWTLEASPSGPTRDLPNWYYPGAN